MTDAPLSLADIAGIDMGDVEEKYDFPWPMGSYNWEIKTMAFGSSQDRNNNEVTTIDVELECIGVNKISGGVNLLPPDFESSQLVGETMRHRFFCRDKAGLGRFKVWLKRIGVVDVAGVDIRSAVEGPDLLGNKFSAEVRHRKNSENPRRPFTEVAMDAAMGLPEGA